MKKFRGKLVVKERRFLKNNQLYFIWFFDTKILRLFQAPILSETTAGKIFST